MRVGRIFVGLLGFVVLLELVLRLFGYGSYIIYQPDERLLWVPAPEQKGVTVAGHRNITINEDGFRYAVTLSRKGKNEIRIFAFGDSVTMGWGVDDELHYSAALERLLKSSRYPQTYFRVVSTGVNAHPNSLVLERFKKVAEDGFQMDIAILAYSFNTQFEGLSGLRGIERKRFLRKVAVKGIVRRFALYNFFIEDIFRNFVYYNLRNRLVQGSWDTTQEGLDVGLVRFTQGLRETKKFSDVHRIRPILLLLGSMDQRSALNSYQKAMVEFAAESKLPLINMIDVLRSKDHDTLFLDHVHPNANGHELIAQELAKAVIKISQE